MVVSVWLIQDYEMYLYGLVVWFLKHFVMMY